MIKMNNYISSSINRYDIFLSIIINFIIILFILAYAIMVKKTVEEKKEKKLNTNEINFVINDLESTKERNKNLVSSIDTSTIKQKKESKIENNNEKNVTTKSNLYNNSKVDSINSLNVNSDINSNNTEYSKSNAVDVEKSNFPNLPKGLIDKGSYYLAENSNINGINYEILDQINPDTTILSKNNYDKKITIKAKILVSENGKVENVVILSGDNPYGIHSEVIKALKKWKFSKLSYNGKPLKIYFIKTFVL